MVLLLGLSLLVVLFFANQNFPPLPREMQFDEVNPFAWFYLIYCKAQMTMNGVVFNLFFEFYFLEGIPQQLPMIRAAYLFIFLGILITYRVLVYCPKNQ